MRVSGARGVFSAAAMAFAGLALLACASHAEAPAGSQAVEEAGRRIVARDCAGCHAVGPEGRSLLPNAPPFRDLHLRYDVEDLAESLAEGIVAGHPAMPSRPYEPEDVAAVIAYLKSLEPPAP